MAALNDSLRKFFMDFETNRHRENKGMQKIDDEYWEKAWEGVRENVPPVRRVLEEEMRRLLDPKLAKGV
jgi:hypothetical protein